MQAVGLARINDRMSDSLAGALAPVEYGYYFVIFYTVLGPLLGLILPGSVGSGFLLIPVLALCFVALGPLMLSVVQSAWLPLACGIVYLFIQVALHGESMQAMYVYQFGPWLIAVVIVQALGLHRPNFLHRFAWFTLFMALVILPFMTLDVGPYERAGLEGVGYGNSNALGGWFGFCVLYLTIRGYIEKRLAYRLIVWSMAMGCLYVITMTVSRGALIAVVASLLTTRRRLLKLGLFPILLLAGLLLGLMEFGAFDQAMQAYALRADQETGRLRVWPILIEKFLNSPVIGWGASQVGGRVNTGKIITPHNGFLLLAVASGVVPLVLFCAYCFRSGMAAQRANVLEQDSVFYLPLVSYTVLITCAGNMDFMASWAIVSLAVPVAASFRQEHIRPS